MQHRDYWSNFETRNETDMVTKEQIKQLIDANETEKAIEALSEMIADDVTDDELFFLRGNAYRKHNDWKNAVSDYCEAMSINPDSPAADAYRASIEILEYYNKDLLNP